MKFAKETIDLLAAYPGRKFRMVHIIRHVSQGRKICKQERNRIRWCVAEALKALSDGGQVTVTKPRTQGGFALYGWA